MQTIKLAGTKVPALGMGTWYLGEGNAAKSQQEIQSLRYGLDHGLTVIDTAEMYGEGASETLVGQAIKPYDRHQLYLISKFYPWHATARQMRKALENSLQRLGTDYLDLYLYHWRGNTPLKETLAGMQALKKAGLIKAYGVSNFDVADLKEAAALPGGDQIAANEVLYNLSARGIDYDLRPYQRLHHQTLIGYSPFNSGAGQSIVVPQPLKAMAKAKGITEHQLLLAWTMRDHDVFPIPKAANAKHMAANIAAMAVTFTADELETIDHAFPAPTTKQPLGMI
ncbi:aldo/keto reductase [Lacticaseibacillus baoqingensis]|uniref:Aldo/keto reductase n=1 Tax=Lacticaseibacillus baoqingensis TaxID=2486013 RepID=A0ABW4E7J4_9LACO|nr:aldo/keto reductase [Lacticaseibacillus baoqingensis]